MLASPAPLPCPPMMRLLLCLLFLFMPPAAAQAEALLAQRDAGLVLKQQIQYVQDARGQLDIAAVRALPLSQWQHNEAQVFNRGYSRSTWWLRLELGNSLADSPRQLLEIAYPVLDDIEVWIYAGSQLRARYSLGDKHEYGSRPVHHRFFLLPLDMPPGSQRTVFLKIRSTSSVQVPLTLWDERYYFEQDQWHLLGHGLFFGILGLMVLYSLMVFVALRDRTYLYYALFIFSMALFLISLKGLAFQFFWPTATQWNDRVLLVTLGTTLGFGGLFTVRFMRMQELLPRFSRLTILVSLGAFVMTATAFFVGYDQLMRPMIMVAGLACLSLLVVGIWGWRRGDRSARLYTLAWSAMLLGGVVLSLSKFDVLPSNAFTENATQIGTTLEVILLAVAIVERINEERRLRFHAQEATLRSERRVFEAQTQALAAEREANEQLEARVQERTQALEAANRRLEELSATDQLTGVKNRRYLDRVLQEEYARSHRYQRSLAVLLLDIDHFKQFNDVWGHQVGDDCLRQVAAVLTESVRLSVDHVARYGGEEFCIVMPETDVGGAYVVAERARAAVAAMRFEVQDRTVPVTISVGLAAETPAHDEGSHSLLQRADQSLYQAKREGRNRVIAAS